MFFAAHFQVRLIIIKPEKLAKNKTYTFKRKLSLSLLKA